MAMTIDELKAERCWLPAYPGTKRPVGGPNAEPQKWSAYCGIACGAKLSTGQYVCGYDIDFKSRHAPMYVPLRMLPAPTYAEISTSGEGLHQYFLVDRLPTRAKATVHVVTTPTYSVVLYYTRSYLLFTGRPLRECDVNAFTLEEVEAWSTKLRKEVIWIGQ